LIDEAERFSLVSNTDAYWSWLAALRELTDIIGVALIFFIGQKSRDEIPVMFAQDEIQTRIGVSNYVEFYDQSRDDVRDFLTELLQTIIRKGPVSNDHKEILEKKFGKEIDNAIPEELQTIVGDDGELLKTYPFTIDAFEKLIDHCATAEYSNRPREVLIMVQKAAGRAMRSGSRLIDSSVLDETSRDGI
jgi:predicted RNA-binding protein Jag